MTLGAKINPFFHIVLLIGLLWLGFNSISSYNTRDTKYKPMLPLLKSISGKTATVCLISAIVFLSTVYAINREKFLIAKEKQRIQEIELHAVEKRFHKLCKENKAEIYQRIDTPKSIYIDAPNTNYFEVLKYMDYVEVKRAANKIYRFTKKEENKNKAYLNRDDVIKEQIKEITSRYHFIESTIRTEENTKHGLFVQTVTLIDTKTNNKLAFYSGVWSRDLKRICPDSYYHNLDTSTIKYVFSISEKADSFMIYQSE